MHEPEFEPYMQEGCCIQRLFGTQANHRTPFRAPRIAIGIGV